ncbi:MAG: long-chain-fatty-acid--CoA ligase [Bdellovibrionaceae bacterium]|nr:long-chain-fatty-acid--CoA ligase [Pseudobdellovibrionaceae bacterium]
MQNHLNQSAKNHRPWLGSYQDGVPAEIDVTQFSSLPAFLEDVFHTFATRPAFHNMGKTLSYAEIDELSEQFACYLQNDLKLKKGDRVAIMMPNLLQYPVALFGILRAGLIAVNCNPLYTARELEYQLKDSGAVAIIVVANFAKTVEEALPKTDVKHVLVTELGDMLGFPKKLIVNAVVKYLKKMVPAFHLPNATSFLGALEKGNNSQLNKPALTREDVAFLQYTGGTTGVAKGAVLTHGNIAANMLQAKAWVKSLLNDGEEIIITPLPLYHIFSLTANCLIFSAVGALNVLITNPRDIPGFIKEMKKWKFSAITGLNTLFNALLNNPEFKTIDFSKLKITLGGGMAVQRAVAERWKEVTKVPLIEAYGLTETSPAACINRMDLKDYNGFIGLPLPSTDMKIVDDNGNEVPTGEAGEICIKGPQVMSGYWQKPEETAKVMTPDGYFRSGDIGTMNEEGYFKIVDRKKDMILVSGFNVYPNEIEEVAVMHPKVLEAAAIAVPDERSGEVPKIFIVKKDDSLTEQEILDFCRKNLTAYKVPKHVEFRTELPKTNVGKILRKALR